MTPVKRIVQRPQPTCTERLENQLGQENQFAHETLAHRIAVHHESLKSIDIDNGLANLEANLKTMSQKSAGVQNRSEFFMEPNRLKSGPFANLRTLIDVEKNSACTTQKENINTASSFIIPIFESTCEDNPPGATSTTSSPGNEGISLGSHMQSYCSHAPDTPLYGNSTPPRPTYDLNFLPRTTSYSSRNIRSQFSPITPDQSKRAQNKEAHDILTLNDERENQESEKQKNIVVDTSEFELPKDLCSAAVSTILHESRNPDKAGNLAIDLNRTPQQKPRRRKHRPKVVIEGQPKRTRKPATPTDTPAGKRKYVRKNKLDKTPGTPTAEATSRTTDPEPAPPAAKFCKRKLNFDSESQVAEERAQNLYTRVESNSHEQTRVGIAYELTCSMNNVVEECISAPSPQTPTRTDPLHENSKARDQHAPIQGKCRIVFSDETHDKRESIIRGMSYEGEQGKGLERGNSYMSHQVNPSRTNASGRHYNALPQYWEMFPAHIYNPMGIPGLCFPAKYKRKRTVKRQSSNTSRALSTVTVAENTVRQGIPWSMNNGLAACTLATAQFISSSMSTETASVIGAQGREQTFEWKLALNQKGRMSKKRAKGRTARHNFGSLIEFVECRHRPTFHAEGGTTVGVMTGHELLHHSPTQMDATMKRKKWTKRNPFTDSEIIQKKIPSANEIAEQLKSLSITNQEQHSLVPYYIRYEDQNALVLYQRHGTVVPFEGSFDPVRKRKLRPRVYLDEETSRVWKLLLENINSEGIDGTDEEKAKWWEEERRVFRGRTNSFIARMHLVQGDRRFSPWKGSVLDSVIGVFLTQNVSDHLSSSAFMSLAAQFPLKSKSNERPCYEEASVLDKETEVCIMDPEDTINRKWLEEMSEQPACNSSSVTFHNTDYFSEKVANNESLGSSSGREKSVDNLDCRSSDISGDGIETYDESTADGKVMQLKQAVGSCTGDHREMDDVLSCQYSSSSCQNSVNSSMAHTAERIRSFFHDNTEAADPALKPNLDSLVGSSFMELLKRQEERLYDHKTGNLSSHEQNGYICTEHDKQNQRVQQVQEVSNLSRETLDAIDSNSSVNKPKNTELKDVGSCLIDHGYLPGMEISGMCSYSSKVKRGRIGEPKQNTKDWDSLRLQAQTKGTRRERTTDTMDSLDWEAVRCADVNEIAYTIRERGMNNKLAERIKDFLNRLVRDHGSIDLEWLRDVPPDKAKEYLLSVRGLGLKSVECVRLLTLHHLAFPVDTNVGRIAVRLGWVPLQPLPESLQLHLLELYPVLESIQRYLWPRLCKLDQRTLYQLHYQMITFGKVFCTKSKPNCNACPMRGECRHFASAFASARLALPGPEEKSIVNATESKATHQNPMEVIKPLQLPLPQANQQLQGQSQISNCEPIVEMPATPEPIVEMPATPEPTVEVPNTPELEQPEVLERDIEDALYKDPEEIPMIKLNIEEFTQNLQHYMQQNMELCDRDISKALVALTPEAASIPMPKLKYINRLRTEHRVYELPDSHPLLGGLDNRDPDDPCSYLLAIWTPGETANSIEQPEKRCSSQEYGKTCDENTCFSCNTIREEDSQIVRGTILIPCRTAMRGSFPLNGTYFQVNEVFADHESSINPIDVPRTWIWNLPRRTVFFGTSIPTIFRGLSTESIQYCFWRGFVCVRGFERKTRAPRPLMARLHFPVSKLKGAKGDTNVKQE